jgi:hypothetical protein
MDENLKLMLVKQPHKTSRSTPTSAQRANGCREFMLLLPPQNKTTDVVGVERKVMSRASPTTVRGV